MIELIKEIIDFRDRRNWAQFHNTKDLAISLSIETAELLELFQWTEAERCNENKRQQLADELADVLIYCLIMCNELKFSPEEIIREKIKKNDMKYPVSKSYGSNKKYTEL